MNTVLVCSNCENPMGNYNHSDIGIICDDCYTELEREMLESRFDINITK